MIKTNNNNNELRIDPQKRFVSGDSFPFSKCLSLFCAFIVKIFMLLFLNAWQNGVGPDLNRPRPGQCRGFFFFFFFFFSTPQGSSHVLGNKFCKVFECNIKINILTILIMESMHKYRKKCFNLFDCLTNILILRQKIKWHSQILP